MTGYLIAAGFVGACAWLKWTVTPVLFAYEVGRRVERILLRSRPASGSDR